MQCDASQAADLHGLHAKRGGRRLAAVLHAGGVLADATFANQDLQSLRQVTSDSTWLTLTHGIASGNLHIRC
jgi:hypothetical protein